MRALLTSHRDRSFYFFLVALTALLALAWA